MKAAFFFNLRVFCLLCTIKKVLLFDLVLHQNTPNSNSNPSEEYQHLLWRIQLELLTKIDGSKSTQCTHFNFVFDSNMFQNHHQQNVNTDFLLNFNFKDAVDLSSNPYLKNNNKNNNVLEDNSVYASTLILNLNQDRNSKRECIDEDIITPRVNPHCSPLTLIYFNTKHGGRPCSLIVMRLTVDHNMETLVENYRLWTFIKLPGFYFQNFYLFLVKKNENKLSSSKVEEQFDFLSNFSMATKKLTNTLFFMENDGRLLARPPNHRTSLYSIGSIKKNQKDAFPEVILNGDRLGLYKSKRRYRNFEQNSILGIVCPICEPDYEIFKATGRFTDYIIASMYQASLLFNATLELEAAFSIPTDGRDENGNWDSFLAPIMEGSAIYSGISRYSPTLLKYVLMTKPVLYDVVTFISARPKRVKFGSLAVLPKPLSLFVWIGISVSIISIFFTVEFIIYMKRKRIFHFYHQIPTSHFNFSGLKKISKHVHYLTLFALLDPVIDQNGLVSKTFTRNIEDSVSRAIIALWFLSLIVLGCAYKSKLFALIVLPHYEKPPSNLEELLHSDYGIGGVFWKNQIECEFNGLAIKSKNNNSLRLGNKIHEFEYFNGDCYQFVLEGKNVCVGFGKILATISVEFTTDVKGRSMVSTSQDTFFHIAAGVAVNREFTDFYEPLESIIRALESTGMFEYWYDKGVNKTRTRGRTNAKNWVEEKPYYKGEANEEDLESGSSGQFAWVLAQLLLLGCGVALISVLFEIIYPWRRDRRAAQVVPFTF